MRERRNETSLEIASAKRYSEPCCSDWKGDVSVQSHLNKAAGCVWPIAESQGRVWAALHGTETGGSCPPALATEAWMWLQDQCWSFVNVLLYPVGAQV